MILYQAFLGDAQRRHVSPCATAYDIGAHSAAGDREYEQFKKILRERPLGSEEPWGLVSWKFEHKCGLSIEKFLEFAQARFAAGAECVCINPMIGNEALFANVWEQGVLCGHRGMDKVCESLMSQLGEHVWTPMGRQQFAFCNYFIATPGFWRTYTDFVDQVTNALETRCAADPVLAAAYYGSASYARDSRVTMRPFVVERLFSTYLSWSGGARSSIYVYGVEQYVAKFGARLGGLLYELSQMKETGLGGDGVALRRWNELRHRILKEPLHLVVMQCDDPSPLLLEEEFASLVPA